MLRPLAMLSLVLTASFLFMAVSSPDAIGFSTGAPAGASGGPGEGTCVMCHTSFPLNSGSAQFAVSAPSSLVGLTSVPLAVSFSGSATPKHGFEVSMRDWSQNSSGSWVAGPGAQVISTNWVTHTSPGNTLTSWSPTWTPPVSLPPGPITFYAAGNEANGNGNNNGDRIYTSSTTIYQADCSSPATLWPVGTTQVVDLLAPGHGGEIYVVVVSDVALPTSLPGGMVTPIAYPNGLSYAQSVMTSVFQDFVGVLDPVGMGQALVHVPAEPGLSGLSVLFAYATLDASLSVTEVSNLLTVTFQ